MKRFLTFVAIVLLIVFFISRWNEQRRVPETFTPATGTQLDLSQVQVLAAMDEEYTRLAEAVVPSVVSLTTSRTVRQPQQPVDPFELFLGRRGRGIPQEFVQNSLGSGVIVSEEGHILTNNHVIAKMDEIKVHLRDGREYPAEVIGGDELTDIAVLKIKATNIRPLPLGDSDNTKVGSLVLAVGNPFGLQETVTHGMISATGRQVSDESGVEFFQTDTAINPGNSGGPLINLRGEIIAINSAIGNYSGSGTWQGVGFAIPANVARRSMEGIIKKGRVVRGYLGISVQELTPELAAHEGMPGVQGVMVVGVVPDSPAAKAGLQQSDVITSLAGKPVKTLRDLLRRVAAMEVGAKVDIEFLRQHESKKVEATIEEQPANYRSGGPMHPGQPGQPGQPGHPFQPYPPSQPGRRMPSPGRGTPAQPGSALYGIEVGEISKEKLGQYPRNVQGVVVVALDSRAPAADGLRLGDVIEEVAQMPITSVAEYNQVAAEVPPGQRVMLSIARGKVRSFLIVVP